MKRTAALLMALFMRWTFHILDLVMFSLMIVCVMPDFLLDPFRVGIQFRAGMMITYGTIICSTIYLIKRR